MTVDPNAVEFVINGPEFRHLLNFAGTFSLLSVLADLTEAVELRDEEIAAVSKLPIDKRMSFLARLDEFADTLREGVRSLDASLLSLREGLIGV